MIFRISKPLLTLVFLGCFIPVLGFAAASTSPAPGTVLVINASTTHNSEQSTVNLSPIVVNGHRIPKPVALQIIKTALHRPWSSSAKDRYQVVCRTPRIEGSLLHTLRCETNEQHSLEQQSTQHALTNALTEYGPNPEAVSTEIMSGAIPIYGEVVNYSNNHRINVGALHRLLAKLPPRGSSYTLKVKSHGRIVAKYIFHKGDLVKVWHRSQAKEKSSQTKR